MIMLTLSKMINTYKYPVVLFALIVLLVPSCKGPTTDSPPTPIEPLLTPKPTAHVAQTSPPPTFNHWQGIIPGQSTQDDVRAILGQPTSRLKVPTIGNGDPRFDVWAYKPPQHDLAPLYGERGQGFVDVYFKDKIVFAVILTFSDLSYNVAWLTREFGKPDIIFSQEPFPPENLTQTHIMNEQGIDWRETTIGWYYEYASLGVGALIGDWMEGYLGIVPVWYPAGSLPSSDVSVQTLMLHEPMSPDEWRNSAFYPSSFYMETAP